MKRLVCCLLAALLLLGLTACGQTTSSSEEVTVSTSAEISELTADSFADGSFTRDSGYGATFKTKYAQAGRLTIHVASTVFDEDTSPALAQTLAETYAALEQAAGTELPELDLYLVSVTDSGAPAVVDGNRVFCALEQAETGSAAIYLVQAAFGLDAYWQCYGLAQVLLGADETDGAALAAWYSDETHTQMLSLLPLYFLELFSDEETVQYAKETAVAITQYLVERDGLTAFLSDSAPDSCRAWLESIGVTVLDLSVLESDAAAELDAMVWSYASADVVTVASDQFLIRIPQLDWLSTAEEIHDYLLYFLDAMDGFAAVVKEDAPTYYASLSGGEIGQITIYLNNGGFSSTYAKTTVMEAYVGRYEDIVHETIHCLIAPFNDDQSAWIAEGLTTYFEGPLRITGIDDPLTANQSIHAALLTDEIDLTDEDRALADAIVAYYQALTGETCSEAETFQDFFAFFEAVGYATLLHPDLKNTTDYMKAFTSSVAEHRGITEDDAGNELTYHESMLFLEYLMDEYGLDAIIAAEMDYSAYQELFPSDEDFYAQFEEFLEQLDDVLA